MIIVKLSGGLGNQFFQYALGRHLAVLNRTELKLDTSLLDTSHYWTYRKFSLEAFNIQALKATQQEINQLTGKWEYLPQPLQRLFRRMSSNSFNEPYFHFYPPALSLQDGIYLEGYWQSEKYFASIAERIREELTPVIPLSNQCETLRTSVCQCNSVSMHIRRGDYITASKANRYLKPCEAAYYQKAVDYLAKRMVSPVFFVFSDDIEWAKANVQFDFPMQFVEGNSAVEDVWLMASCHHHIIANSTFSWWGAWLNRRPGKIIIAPQKWFSTERFDTRDLLPESWIRL
jgi:hypothetical protein